MGILIRSTGIQGILVGVTGSHLTGPFFIECGTTATFFLNFSHNSLFVCVCVCGISVSSAEGVSSVIIQF